MLQKFPRILKPILEKKTPKQTFRITLKTTSKISKP
jgi:hypothetical protein